MNRKLLSTLESIEQLLERASQDGPATKNDSLSSVRKLLTEAREQAASAMVQQKLGDNVLSYLPAIVCYVDTNLNYVFLNPAYETWFGIDPEQALHKNMRDVIGESAFQKILPYLQRALYGERQDFVAELPYKTGGTKSVRVTYAPDVQNGKVLGITAITDDVTSLRHQECEQRALFEAMADGYVVQDSSLKILKFNAAACEILGKSEKDLLGITSYDLAWKLLREDGSPYPSNEYPSALAILSGKAVYGAIMGIDHPMGERRWIRINAIPFCTSSLDVSIADKSERKVVCTFSDVTDLIASQSENRFILEALKIGVWKFNPVTQALAWSDSMYDLFDVKRSEFSGDYQAWEATLVPKAKEKAIEELGQALRGEKEYDTVFEIKSQTEETRFIGARGKVIRDEAGKPVLMYGINWDVTKIKAAEKALKAEEKLISAILDIPPVGVFVKDIKNEFKWTLFNRHAEKLFGIKASFGIGKDDYRMFPKEQADFFRAKDIEASNTSGAIEIPDEMVDTASGPLHLRTRKIVIRDAENRPSLLVGVTEDITDQVNMKRTMEVGRAKATHNSKMASLGEMSAGVAHEINNPLAIIAGSIEQIPSLMNDPEKFGKKVFSIQRSVERISKIVNGLRKFARSGEKRQFVSCDLLAIVHEVLVLTNAKSTRHFTPVKVEGPEGLIISCDEVEIEQVLVNLVNNAIDAVKNRVEKWVNISIFEKDSFVVLQITDSGPGIPKELRDKLFQPFFTTKIIGEGTGLGLSIASGILDDHRATIALLEDRPNTCFEVRFPKVKEVVSAH